MTEDNYGTPVRVGDIVAYPAASQYDGAHLGVVKKINPTGRISVAVLSAYKQGEVRVNVATNQKRRLVVLNCIPPGVPIAVQNKLIQLREEILG